MGLSMKSRKELSATTAARYREAKRAGKASILQEFCKSTEYNRAYAATLLRGYGIRRVESGPDGVTRVTTTKVKRSGGGRPRLYDAQVQRVVVNLWRRLGYLCGKRLVPIVRRCIPTIRRDRFLRPSVSGVM